MCLGMGDLLGEQCWNPRIKSSKEADLGKKTLPSETLEVGVRNCVGFIICRLFDDHSDWCEVILYCRFYLHLASNLVILNIFTCFFGHIYVIYKEMSM